MGKHLGSIRPLVSWFERQKRVLPWRDRPEVYRVWISEIMLQQTQVATVIPYFEKFIQRFPDVQALAKAPEEEVMLHWAGLGYYSRARNLHKAAKQICSVGDFPRDREGWLGIPGVGEYTAGAILSIAYNKPEAILDGNVERVFSRYWMVPIPREAKAQLWDHSRATVKKAFDQGLSPSDLNQALMELGALVCTPRSPQCGNCPLKRTCSAKKENRVSEFPSRARRKKKWVHVKESRQFIFNKKGILLKKGRKGEWRVGLWDLPETIPASLPSSQMKSLGEQESRHIVTRHKIQRSTRVWKLSKVAFQACESDDGVRWFGWEELGSVPLGSAFKRTLSQIRENFPEAAPKD